MPSELPDQVLLKVICSYSSRYPSLQWTEEFASISPQWKHVIDTNRDQLPRLLVHTVKVRGSQLEILLQPNDPQPTTGGRREPVILNDQAENTAATLCRIAARSLIISLGKLNVKHLTLANPSEQNETLEEVLVYVGDEGLRATSVSLEPLGRLVDAMCLTHIMRAIGETHTLKAKITCTRDIEALMPAFPRHIHAFVMDLGSCRALDDDSALNLFLYFANRVMSERFYFDFVIERYHSDALELANRFAKVASTAHA